MPRVASELNKFLKAFGVRVVYRRVRRRRRVASAASKKGFAEHKARALELVLDRLAHFNQHYKFSIGRVSIKNQTSRWGSCSKKGNLNFNYRLVHLSSELVDYVIVHELCHLGEFNHSRAFWNLVAQTVPNHAALRLVLRKQPILTRVM